MNTDDIVNNGSINLLGAIVYGIFLLIIIIITLLTTPHSY